MRLLEHFRLAPLFRRALSLERTATWRKILPGVAFLVMLEVLGRWDAGRTIDTVACFAFVAFCVFVAMSREWSRDDPLVVRWRARFERWSDAFRLDSGVDLRGTPPLPTRIPRSWGWASGIGFVALSAMALSVNFVPTFTFDTLREVSGLAFVVALTVTWITLIGVGISVWAAAWLWFKTEFDRPRQSILTALACDLGRIAMAVAALYAAYFGSPAVAVAWLLASTALWGVVDVVTATSQRRVFRTKNGTLAWTPLGLWTLGQVAPPALFAATLVLFATGDSIAVDVFSLELFETRMSLTARLGNAVAWSLAITTGVVQIFVLASLWLERRADPALGFRTRVYAEGLTARSEKQLFQRSVGHFGFLARFAPARRRKEEVPVRVASTIVELDPWHPSPWPRPVTWSELEDDRLHQALRRRDEIQRRRHLIRGLDRAFRGLQEERRRRRGRTHEGAPSGTWVAPHLWTFPKLLRDDGPDGSPWVGPAFRKVIPQSARAHLYRVLRALEVDLIFLEDGIDYRKFRRVLRLLFEYYDLFGRRPLEERHFSGVPGVRVILHDFTLDEPYRSDTYPEPEAQDLGRGRFLHVFRDRGEDEARVEIPEVFDWIPTTPVLTN